MIILLDFDGTCTWQLSEPGYALEDPPRVCEVLNRLIRNRHKIILWTSRNDSLDNPYNYYVGTGELREETSLDEAIRWFRERNILLSGVNGYPGEEQFVGTSRKPYGELIIDDMCLGIPRLEGEIDYIRYYDGEIVRNHYTYCVNWPEIEKLLESRGII